MKELLTTILIIAGLISLSIGAYFTWQRNNPARLSFTTNESLSSGENKAHSLTPTRIKINSLDVDTPIYQAKSPDKNNKWDVTEKGASYLSSSPIPGEYGNSIIYGHNWKNIFGMLPQAKPGDKITIIFSNGSEKNFEIHSTQEVNPDQSSVLSNTNDTRLTIYTCTGIFDQRRFIVTAFPINNSKPASTMTFYFTAV